MSAQLPSVEVPTLRRVVGESRVARSEDLHAELQAVRSILMSDARLELEAKIVRLLRTSSLCETPREARLRAYVVRERPVPPIRLESIDDNVEDLRRLLDEEAADLEKQIARLHEGSQPSLLELRHFASRLEDANLLPHFNKDRPGRRRVLLSK